MDGLKAERLRWRLDQLLGCAFTEQSRAKSRSGNLALLPGPLLSTVADAVGSMTPLLEVLRSFERGRLPAYRR